MNKAIIILRLAMRVYSKQETVWAICGSHSGAAEDSSVLHVTPCRLANTYRRFAG
jgi:hypothetical protein